MLAPVQQLISTGRKNYEFARAQVIKLPFLQLAAKDEQIEVLKNVIQQEDECSLKMQLVKVSRLH